MNFEIYHKSISIKSEMAKKGKERECSTKSENLEDKRSFFGKIKNIF